jgi:holin-like protein
VLAAVSTLLLFQFIGEALATLTHVPVPGPLIGMLLLLAWLMFRGGPSEELESFGRSLLSWTGGVFRSPLRCPPPLVWQRLDG